MQTFLPYPNYLESALCLDTQRLGKQRLECRQILATLGYHIVNGRLEQCTPHVGWINHPAVKMWRHYESALAEYYFSIVASWKARGFTHTMEELDPNLTRIFINPPWLGDESFHASHRSNLLRKNPAHYAKYGWKETPDLPYVWPEPGPGPTDSTEF